MANQQSSELLRVMEQLGDAAWAETLLPQLRANKSAGAVALTCKQLRQLCHGNQRELKLTGANCKHLGPPEVDAFSRPFPACSSVAFTADSTNDVGLHLACVLPLLARLADLQSLQLTINSRTASFPAQTVPALQLLRLQLPQLRSLRLALGSNWDRNSQQAWEVLGATTQLTKLEVNFRDSEAFDEECDDPNLSLEHLSALRPLGSGLQHLELIAQRVNIIIPEDCSFLSSFSGLTSLRLPLNFKRSGLAAISSCTALQQLRLTQRTSAKLDAAACAALAQLTRLTELDIPPSSDTPALLAALPCLSGLQVLGLRDASSRYLPVLATLTNLTTLRCCWVDTPAEQEAAAAGASQHACPAVVEVSISGPFPLVAFPGATAVAMCNTWQPARLAGLSQHMKALEVLTIKTNTSTFRSLDPAAPEAGRVAAVRSLGQLVQLTELQFALNDDAEAAALAAACSRVYKLKLFVPLGSSVTAMGLASGLCRLSKLRVLNLVLYGLQLCRSEARLLLTGLSGVRELFVHVTKQEQRVWRTAAAAAREAGLPLPDECRSYCVPS